MAKLYATFKSMKKLLIFLVTCHLSPVTIFAAPNMTAEINMDTRASTAAAAKKEATDSAIRIATMQILSRYSDRAVVENLIMGTDDAALQNMIATTGISNEKQSRTAYSARFSITLDRGAVEKWYSDNNVPNFISSADESRDKVLISIELNSLSDWGELNRILREDGDTYGLALRSIYRNNATAYILTNKRKKFQNVCSNNGWGSGMKDGILRVWKVRDHG